MTTHLEHRRALPVLTVAAIGAVGLAVLAAWAAGLLTPAADGIADPGALTRWALPATKAALDVAASLTVGFSLVAFLHPPKGPTLAAAGLRALSVAARAGTLWAGLVVLLMFLTLSDLLAEPVSAGLTGNALPSFVWQTAQGRAYATTLVLLVICVAVARLTLRRGGALGTLALAMGAAIVPAFTGHAASGSYHSAASTALVLHVVAASSWAGGLAGCLWLVRRDGAAAALTVSRYSSVALAAAITVLATGLAGAWWRLPTPTAMFESGYGRILMAKAALAVLAIAAGAWHRQRSLPRLLAGESAVFRRIASMEVLVLISVLGLAATLSRTPPPGAGTVSGSPAADLLGVPVPPPLTAGRLVTQIYPDVVFGAGCLAAALLYLAGVRRLRRRGDRWPTGRTAAWLAGVALIVLMTWSGVATYAMVMLSVHMSQHMVLTMLVPVLLVLGGPITLALRALRPAPPGQRGPREWLASALRHRATAVLTHPLIALALFATAPFTVYVGGLFDIAVANHGLHTLMTLHFLLVGFLFFDVLVGVDPLPGRPPYAARFVLWLMASGAHTFFGIVLMMSSRLLAADWYAALGRELRWLPDPLSDQKLAGNIAWGAGELLPLLMIGVLVVQWMRSDDRQARRLERRPEVAEAELARYNAWLARLGKEAERLEGRNATDESRT